MHICSFLNLNLSSHFIIRTQTQHHFMISWYIMIFQTLSRKSQKPWSITPMRRECCRAQWWHSGQTLLKLGNSCIHPRCTRFGENDNHCFVWCRHLYNFHLPYWKYFHNKTDQWPPRVVWFNKPRPQCLFSIQIEQNQNGKGEQPVKVHRQIKTE